jgi:hypothetical protein
LSAIITPEEMFRQMKENQKLALMAAAAPELLKALKVLAKEYGDTLYEETDAYAYALSVIKKAEGES